MIKPGMFISDRYEIIDKAGSGGMADVYKAKCHRLNRYVAIKILKPEFSSDKNFVMKFRGEAQSAAGLSHPNIVSVYDVGDDDIEGIHFIVMELVEGITLKRFIERKGRLDVKEAIGIGVQIAQGMEAAHANHIIHRDIKPQTIIISRDGKVKVADFGIAKAATSDTVTQNAIGSVHYLSPEQARGGYSDERSDIYSLGVTLYEMLSGHVPFAGDNSVSVALLHIQGEARPLHEINPDIPRGLDMIVQKCMQKKPERRYNSASELIQDLKKSLMNPDGDFVKMAPGSVLDSPTIHLSDEEMNHIKSASKKAPVYYDNKREPIPKKVKKEEEEELDSIDSRLEKVLLPLSIAAAIILGLTILFLLAKFFGLFGGGDNEEDSITSPPSISAEGEPTQGPTPTEELKKQVVVVSVLSMTPENAEAALKAISDQFTITVLLEGGFSDTVPEGRVMKQSPEPNTSVAVDEKITLTLSLGPEKKTDVVPDVVGKGKDDAEALLLSRGFVPKQAGSQSSDTVPAGLVLRTDPSAGTDLEKGSQVNYYLSAGPDKQMVVVPYLLGYSEEAAVKLLQDEGLKLGGTTPVYSTKYAEGEICYQSYSEGQKVEKGTVINLSVSLGPEEILPTPTPDLPKPKPTKVPPEPTKAPEPTEEPTDDTFSPEEEDPDVTPPEEGEDELEP